MTYNNVLITGGAGFIGSQLVKKILPLSRQIYVLDDLSTGRKDLIPISPKVQFIQASITDKDVLKSLMPKVEYVFHLACSNIVKSVINLEQDFHTNLYGGYLLLEAALKHCPNLERFVYTSTTSVYGESTILPTPEAYYNINLPYAASKLSAEHYCAVYHHLYQLPVSVLRFSNVFGPGQSPENPYCGVVAKFFEAVNTGEPMVIYGDGQQTRDFTYIEDALESLLLVAKKEAAIGQVYNVGTGIETSIISLADAISQATNSPNYPLEFKPKRLVDIVQRRNIDASKIGRELHWQANYSVLEGLAATFEWLRGDI